MKTGKIKTLISLNRIISNLKKQNKKIVFTNGCFDLLHIGHIRTFKKAKSLGDVLIVAVNSDKSVRKLKGKNRPIIKDKFRMEVLSAIEYIDYIVKFDEDTPIKLIKYLKPDIIVKGSDWKKENVVGKELSKVVLAPFIKGWSTTEIINKIKNID
jgi:D-beta-D-heptose 7-phosphate kinase/D-beta-D-heptose 1-phosphate adenosyltransferase